MILETNWVLSGVVGVFGAGIGWVLTEFVARPIRRFFDLRGEVIRRMAQYADIPKQVIEREGGEIETPDVTEETRARAREAESVIRDLAAQMLSFAYNETFATSILALLRYDPRQAAEGLAALSWLHAAEGRLKDKPRELVAKALRIDQGFLF